MEIPNNFYRTSIKALVLDDKKRFLLCKEENGYWDLPGGGMHFGEKYEKTLKREIFEETGLEITEIGKRPKYFLVFKNIKNNWTTNILFEVKLKNLEITPSDECVEVRFFNKEEVLKENLFPSVVEFVKMFDEDEK